ncbi:protein tyrosine phosphatase [Heyndrickxia sporothermodurans]|uniref:Dual specificity protein phosphatase family protein n=1 Tax=Heyndrickxia sporothermodurans TaxID=46224 RepID=A0AB37HDZ4_9BACI|nr:dual specificity protein phosphatase family protein [Heyndrickxia sporothermodurans]MBL5767370.1 dual specificity protein phosphatase family protein [Heyndrickxia sporothermodurans]MBL5770843.1 dual specificity protein phosphatase family protein [Heyndrickxia sporothermodurans]MBL5774483.1 dual specificity protein phosphatase family protein [Heyndrickxia sporothermodurans]MBL5776938.1 dual specificity protein phosphatase family protein [Heyndrickxia sporothermodurans]MBL5781569.1 dual speci
MTTKNYHELIKDRIYIGGADDVNDLLENEKIDVVFDLRAEAPIEDVVYNLIHSPIVDDAADQEESIKKSIDHVIKAYNEGKNIYFHCQGGSNRTGTVAIGTLLALEKASTIAEAEEIAKAARPKINVKPEMKEALKRIYPNG